MKKLGAYFNIPWSNSSIVPTFPELLSSILTSGLINSDVFPTLYVEGMGQMAAVRWLKANGKSKVLK
jgi:hypothetical protein